MRRALVAAVCLGLLLSAQAVAGVYYEATTKGEGRSGQAQAAVVKGWVHGDSARVEFVESGNPMMAEGGYMLTKDGGVNMFFVNPKEKTYSKFDLESMGQMVGGVSKMMNMKFSDVKTEDLGEEMGGVIVGLPTTHYKFRVSYTMSMSFMGMKQNSKIVQDKEVWAAPKLVEAALGIWLRKSPPKMGDEEFDKLVRAQAGKIQGFPLKTITKQTTTDKNGKTETTTTIMEVTKLELDMIPNVSFDVPAGYKEVDMFGAMGGEGKDGEENPLAKMLGGKK
jgi:hypothetical protein